MKKTLLSLGLLGLALQGFAQAQYAPRFIEVNPATTSLTPPDYVIEYLNTVSPDLVWGTMYDRTQTTTSTASGFRSTTDVPVGENFEYFPIASRQNPTFLTSNIAGIDALTAVASTFGGTAGGGEVVRTTDGGATWGRVTTAAQFQAPDGFNNFVHMFNPTDGVAFGDPNSIGGTGYEVLLTSNGGVTWTRNNLAGLVPTISGEFGLTRAFTARGNTIWASGGVQANATAGTPGGVSRIFKNTNKGIGAWTAVTLPSTFLGPATDLAFRDDLHGIAMNTESNTTAILAVNIAITSNGGTTWTHTRYATPIIGAAGSFYFTGLDVSQGRFISYGRRNFGAGATNTLADFGYSTSTDGITWTNVQTSTPFVSLDVLDGNGEGYGGYVTDDQDGSGGIFKTVFNGATQQGALNGITLATRNAALQQALSVYPNPSANGVFTLKLNSGVKAGTQVVIHDVVGRQVYSRLLNGTAVNAQSVTIDLNQQKAGVYTLELRTNEGTAQQKLVIE